MLFSTPEYFLFFVVTLALFYLSPAVLRRPLLLVASYVFYATWNWRFIPLLLTLTAIDYVAAIWIEDRTGRARRFALIASVAANLGFLFFFKYLPFVSRTVGFTVPFDIVLPLGISFHTFQSISYVVDVYRGQRKAVRKPLDYALFIAFFPQLVAGPIVRAHDFFGDLYAWRYPSGAELKRGFYLVAMGLTKKVALADNFALRSDRYFSNVGAQQGGLETWAGVFAFAMQIFFDFSGYSDMAIGFALLLGFHFPANFRRPYLAISITDFWRRWHISLSSWLRDYLYIPLGGNRRGAVRTYFNLLITMCLGGLWHGANWAFLVWGAYHGSLLALERVTGLGKVRNHSLRWLEVPRAVTTFALVCVGWIFFRANNLTDALTVLRRLVPLHGRFTMEPVLMAGAIGSLVIALVEEYVDISRLMERAPLPVFGLALGLLLFFVETLGPAASRNFVYFQF